MDWLLLLLQLPPKPDYLRVKVWRRLQALGAVTVKNAVYALPDHAQAREDLQWLRVEINGAGGEAAVCRAQWVAGLDDAQLCAQFNAARNQDYAALVRELEQTRRQLAEGGPDAARPRRNRHARRLAQIQALDHFGADGQQAAQAQLAALDAALTQSSRGSPAAPPQRPLAALWVTRPGVGVDRMASAWLIRRFVDPQAGFAFAEEPYSPQHGELRYDMAEAEYTHRGKACTFEVLAQQFAADDMSLAEIGRMIHDLDLKDDAHGLAETPGLGLVLAGIAAAPVGDGERLTRAAVVLDALYEGLGAGKA